MSSVRGLILALLIVATLPTDALAAPCFTPEFPFLPQSREDIRLFADLLRRKL